MMAITPSAQEPDFVVAALDASDPARASVERFIEAEYARAFSGRLNRHYPTLIAAMDAGGRVVAAAGFRPANLERLFLEQYFDEPIEQVIAGKLGGPVRRREVGEIGNFASKHPCAARLLFLALANQLEAQGCTYAVATATRHLRRSLGRLSFHMTPLGKAEATRLGAAGDAWGGYYARDPQVLVGDISRALPALRSGLFASDRLARRLAQRVASPSMAQSGAAL